jgi:Zn-dependent protease with chaperone function
MFEMNASAKYTGSNAYVTGFGASKRVVVWDTAINSMPAADVIFTFAHELGHYVLNHVVKGFVFAMAYCFVLFCAAYKLALVAIRRWGTGWGIRGLDDWASLPLLTVIVSVLLFLSAPGLDAFSRHLEHDADIYGLEVIHGLVPDSQQVAAHSFQHLGEEWLEYPYVSKFAELWLWNHPTNSDRVHFAATYDPWQPGRSPKFVK